MIIKTPDSLKNTMIDKPSVVADLIKNILSLEDEIEQGKEHLYSIGIDNRNHLIYIDLVSIGAKTECTFSIPQVFRRAIAENVNSIFIVHNHPSGNPEPSEADLLCSKEAKKAGKIIQISLLDSLVIGGDDFYSFRAHGII
jgi:DNA repair protein RadC